MTKIISEMGRLEQLDYINRILPDIIEAFKQLNINQIKAPEGALNYYLGREDAIQFSKETYDNNHFSQIITIPYFTDDDKLSEKVCTYTESLKIKVEKLIDEKIKKMSDIKYNLAKK
jgi:hypothetical protein